jgi:hypothetical protein
MNRIKKIALAIIFILFVFNIHGQEINTKIFNAFKQASVTEGGNCVSIALIKAAYSKYGDNGIFKSVEKRTDVYTVVMRDNSIISFSQEELGIVTERANFKLKDSTDFSIRFKEYAEFCYTAMCKKNQILEGYKKFNMAITDLNNGYNTKFVNRLLGLKFKKIKPHRASKINKLEHLVIYNTYHAVYASKGYYDECWNESGIEKIENLKWKRFGWKCMWKMCSISGVYMIVD